MSVNSDAPWPIALSRLCAPREGSANLFGVILYTREQPHITRVLRDRDYWAALNEAAGPRWEVFAAIAEPPEIQVTQPPVGTMGSLRAVEVEPAINLAPRDAFGMAASVRFPALVVFCEDASGQLWSHVASLSDASDGEAFGTLQSALRSVAQSLEGMIDEYRRVDSRAFHVATATLTGRAEWTMVRRLLKGWVALKEVIPGL